MLFICLQAFTTCFARTDVVTEPTPAGTGVIIDALSTHSSNLTSPQSLPSAFTLIPTSITTAPSEIKSPVTISALPTAAITTSCLTAYARKVVCTAVADSNCSVFIKKEHSKRFAYYHASAYNRCSLALHVNAVVVKYFNTRLACAWRIAVLSPSKIFSALRGFIQSISLTGSTTNLISSISSCLGSGLKEVFRVRKDHHLQPLIP